MSAQLDANYYRVGDQYFTKNYDSSSGRMVLVQTTPDQMRAIMGDKLPGFSFDQALQKMNSDGEIQTYPDIQSLAKDAWLGGYNVAGLPDSRSIPRNEQNFNKYFQNTPLAQDTRLQQYLSSTGQTYNPQTGFSNTPGQLNNLQTATPPTNTQYSTPAYRDAQGNVYDAQGNHLTMDQLQKGPDGKPTVNLTTLPLKTTGPNTSGSSGSGTSGTSNTGTSIYRDNSNNFFQVDSNGNKTPLSLDQFHSLGINADFVPAGQTVPLSQAQTGQGTSGRSGTSGNPSWLDSNAMDGLHFLGVSDAQIQNMLSSDPAGLQNFALTGEYLKKQNDLGQSVANANLQSIQDAYNAALNDPNIKAKYGDLQQSDVANFNQKLQTIQAQTSSNEQLQQLQFQKQQRDLANAQAQAGTAYSGFRKQAQDLLNSQQSNVIQSTTSALKNQLQSTLSPLEQFYGSNKFGSLFPNTGINFMNPISGQTSQISYSPIGNLTGTETAQKQADVANRQQQIYQNIATPTQ